MLKKIALGIMLVVILVFNVMRFWKTEAIPHGFHVDEVASAFTVQCMVQQVCDAELKSWPLFATLQYGSDKPPTYIYPSIIWAKLFGASVPSLRSFSVFIFIIALAGLFFLARHIAGVAAGIVTVMVATCSPWAWVMVRVAVESFLAPALIIWGLYLFWRSNHWRDWAFAGLFFALAMYSYPPARLQVPLMLITLGVYEWGRRPLRVQSCVAFVVIFVGTLLPMVPYYLNGQLARRFSIISIFNLDYLHSLGKTNSWGDVTSVFFHNYLLHLSPDFLFLTGDPSLVHSTRHLGIFSWMDIGALVVGIILALALITRARGQNPLREERGWLILWMVNFCNAIIPSARKDRRLLIFLIVNFFIAIIPSALTNQELPHAMRMCMGWVFVMLLTGYIWRVMGELFKPVWLVAALMGALCAGVLSYQYFVQYPQESRGMFDFWVKDQADSARTDEDWQQFLLQYHRRNYHCLYFLVEKKGLTCRQAHGLWWRLHDVLQQHGLF